MARTDEDTWDLATGVGATATAVAAARALATRAGLIEDPLAEPLVTAVGVERFLAILDGRPGDASEVERMAQGMAVRTRYFDDSTSSTLGSLSAVTLSAGSTAPVVVSPTVRVPPQPPDKAAAIKSVAITMIRAGVEAVMRRVGAGSVNSG